MLLVSAMLKLISLYYFVPKMKMKNSSQNDGFGNSGTFIEQINKLNWEITQEMPKDSLAECLPLQVKNIEDGETKECN